MDIKINIRVVRVSDHNCAGTIRSIYRGKKRSPYFIVDWENGLSGLFYFYELGTDVDIHPYYDFEDKIKDRLQ